MSMCPCGLIKAYKLCCEPLHRGKRHAQTAEELMRSRYSAYVQSKIQYLADTQLDPLDLKQAKKFSKQAKWQKLEVISTQDGQSEDTTGVVEFKAFYRMSGRLEVIHEVSYFEKKELGWLYLRPIE